MCRFKMCMYANVSMSVISFKLLLFIAPASLMYKKKRKEKSYIFIIIILLDVLHYYSSVFLLSILGHICPRIQFTASSQFSEISCEQIDNSLTHKQRGPEKKKNTTGFAHVTLNQGCDTLLWISANSVDSLQNKRITTMDLGDTVPCDNKFIRKHAKKGITPFILTMVCPPWPLRDSLWCCMPSKAMLEFVCRW